MRSATISAYPTTTWKRSRSANELHEPVKALGVIDRTAAALMAREQHELVDRNRTAAEQGVMRKKRHDFFARRRFQSCQRDVGREFARLGFQPDAQQRRLDLLLQMHQRVVRAHAGPQGARILAAEFADAREFQRKSRRPNGGERVVDIVRDILIDFADEAEREMQLAVAGPARARYAALQREQTLAHAFGHFQRNEKSNHD